MAGALVRRECVRTQIAQGAGHWGLHWPGDSVLEYRWHELRFRYLVCACAGPCAGASRHVADEGDLPLTTFLDGSAPRQLHHR